MYLTIISFITSKLGKYILLGTGVLLILFGYGCIKCSHIRADKARIDHNNQKRDDYVDKEKTRTYRYSELEKRRLDEAPKVKKYDKKLTPKQIKDKRDKNIQDMFGLP